MESSVFCQISSVHHTKITSGGGVLMAKAHRNQNHQQPLVRLPKLASHLLRFFLFLVFIVVVLVLLLLFVGLLDLTQSFPFLRKSIGLSLVIGDNDVVEYCTSFDLPQIKTEESEIGIAIDRVIVDVLWVGNFLCLPDSLVSWIGDALSIPVTLVGCIVLHGRLPLTILFIIPVIWLLGLIVDNALLFHPVIGLLVF